MEVLWIRSSFTNNTMDSFEEPPDRIALSIVSRTCTAFLRIMSPIVLASKFISVLIAFSISSHPTVSAHPPFSAFTLTPTPTVFSIKMAFIIWSDWIGMATMGTPKHMLSNVEFHPQCDKKPPMEGCARTCNWGTHSTYTIPLDFVLSKNPSGRMSDKSRSIFLIFDSWEWCLELEAAPRNTQKKRCPLFSRPSASSLICVPVSSTMLPKQIYNTEAFGCWSNHSNHGSDWWCLFACNRSRNVRVWSLPSKKPSKSGPIVKRIGTCNITNKTPSTCALHKSQGKKLMCFAPLLVKMK